MKAVSEDGKERFTFEPIIGGGRKGLGKNFVVLLAGIKPTISSLPTIILNCMATQRPSKGTKTRLFNHPVICFRWADKMKATGEDGKERLFNHPFLQALTMFLGEIYCLLAFKIALFIQIYRQRQVGLCYLPCHKEGDTIEHIALCQLSNNSARDG